jgi:hypothetical protein
VVDIVQLILAVLQKICFNGFVLGVDDPVFLDAEPFVSLLFDGDIALASVRISLLLSYPDILK